MFYFKRTFTAIGLEISTINTYLFYVACISNLHYTYRISKDFILFFVITCFVMFKYLLLCDLFLLI